MSIFARFAVVVSVCSLGCAHLSAQTPAAPVHVYAFKTAVDQVTLTWDAPSGSTPAAAYNIYRMGKKVGATGQTTYKDTGLNMGEGYAYTVKAALASGVESPPSAAVDVVMPFTAGGLAQGGDGLCQPASVSARAQENVDAVKRMLPALLADADRYEALVAKLQESESVDFIHMGIRMLRSIPIALTCDPKSFAWSLPPSALQAIQEALPYFYEHAQNRSDPYKGMLSGVVAVKSPIDGYIDFYDFRLPPDYSAAKKYPLYIELHAASYCKWEAGGLDLPVGKPSTARPNTSESVYLIACARGPGTSYTLMAQPSVFEAVADASKRFSIDANRVTARGGSMGATGALRLSTLYPDAFSGVGALTGSPYYRLPAKDYRYDASMLVPNLKDLNVVLWEALGDPGTWKLEQPIADALGALHEANPGYYNFRRYLDPAGSHGRVEKSMLKEGEDFIAAGVRNLYPANLHYTTGSEQYDGAYWVHGMIRGNVNAAGEIDVEAAGDKITVKTSNLRYFALDLGRENTLFKAAANLTLTIDGEPLSVASGQMVYFSKDTKWASGKAAPAGTLKRKGVSGPLADVFMHGPVLMVYGTKEGNDAMRGRAMTDELLQAYFGDPESAGSYIHYGPFEVKADTEVNEADIRAKNLVLFGTPAQNAMVARVAPNLTFKFGATGGRVGHSGFGGSTGWSILNPNPLNPARYVLLVSEHANMSTFSSSGINSNVLQNDWVVIDAVKGNNTRKVADHGTFDSAWK
ncbi:MAG: hypothetical protein ABI383_00950 [Acidobacteriaceae bacterium]